MADATPLVRVEIARTDARCPFLNERVAFALRAGEVLWLRGASGSGKSFTMMHLAGLATLPGATCDVRWDADVREDERLGVLFQRGVLLDALSLAENVALALRACARTADHIAVGDALRCVGLSLSADGAKMPGELSGGMLRRAALAQVLAQRKRLIVLDEPFVGLDPPVAREIAALLSSVATERRVAFILVSHLDELAAALAPSRTIELARARPEDAPCTRQATRTYARLRLLVRVRERLADYLLYSLPLITCAFAATGAAVSMLLADMLQRVDVAGAVSNFLKQARRERRAPSTHRAPSTRRASRHLEAAVLRRWATRPLCRCCSGSWSSSSRRTKRRVRDTPPPRAASTLTHGSQGGVSSTPSPCVTSSPSS